MEKITIIEAHDKYGTDIVRAPDNTLGSAALTLLAKRVKDGYWYDYPEGSQEYAAQLVEDQNGGGAWKFLYERRDYEYEWVEAREI